MGSCCEHPEVIETQSNRSTTANTSRRNSSIIFDKYSKQKRIHFLHARNIKYVDDSNSFVESGHLDDNGSLDLYEIIKVLVNNGFAGYVRPDHGRNIFGEDGKPGYGLYDRALGVMYLNGLFEAIERNK